MSANRLAWASHQANQANWATSHSSTSFTISAEWVPWPYLLCKYLGSGSHTEAAVLDVE